MWICGRAGEDHLADFVFTDQCDEAFQPSRWVDIQVILVQARIDLFPDAKRTAGVTRTGKEDVGEIEHVKNEP